VGIYFDRRSLENPKVNRGAGAFVHSSGANDTDGGVVNRELLVLLERLAKGVQPVADQVFQTAYTCNAYLD
jgi:hypothetical protein